MGGCNQNCTNTIGSFFCVCFSGYELPPEDQFNCTGTYFSCSAMQKSIDTFFQEGSVPYIAALSLGVEYIQLANMLILNPLFVPHVS